MPFTEEQVRQMIREEIAELFGSSTYTFQKPIQLFDGRNIQLGKSTGTIIGTEATQKLGFFGATPVVQQTAITAPSGGAVIDSQARTTIGFIINVLHAVGITG